MKKVSLPSTITTLDLATVTRIMANIKGGRFASVEYVSQCDTIDGAPLFKVSKVTIIAKAKAEHCNGYTAPAYTRTEDSTYLVNNAVKHNNKTGNTLLVIHPLWKTLKKRYVDGVGNPVTEAAAVANIKPRPASAIPVIITPNAANIISIKG